MELPKEKQNIKWLILIWGFQPILDDKFDTFSLPEFKRTANGASGLVEDAEAQTKTAEDTIRLVEDFLKESEN